MNVKEAVALAKQEVAKLFADELAENIGLEEVEYDDAFKNWRITIGFSRPWDATFFPLMSTGPARRPRSYKVITLAENGEVVSVRNHAKVDA